MDTKVFKKLMTVQSKLKAPKDCRNEYGNYNYRKAEDILEAVKPLLAEVGAIVRIDDLIELIGDRYYVKALASFVDIEDGQSVCTCAFAREPLTKKGMDEAQITGATSSYARKYALNGLFAIDDSSQDPDVTNRHEDKSETSVKEPVKQKTATKPAANPKMKKAWEEIKKLASVKIMKETQKADHFRNFIKSTTGKDDPYQVTDAEWDKVLNEIDIMASL